MSKYDRIIKGVKVDVYDILSAFQVTDPALQHLLKKALCAGDRGHKDRAQDLQDIVDSALRAQAMHQEKEIAMFQDAAKRADSGFMLDRIGDLLRMDHDHKITPPPGGWKIGAVMSLTNTGYITTGESSDPEVTATVTVKNDGAETDDSKRMAEVVKEALSKCKADAKPGDSIRQLKSKLMAYEPRDLRYEAIRALDRLANAVDGRVDGNIYSKIELSSTAWPTELEEYFKPVNISNDVQNIIAQECQLGGLIWNFLSVQIRK